jgi:hypothetical protein
LRKKHKNTDFRRSVKSQSKIVQIYFFEIPAIYKSDQL